MCFACEARLCIGEGGCSATMVLLFWILLDGLPVASERGRSVAKVIWICPCTDFLSTAGRKGKVYSIPVHNAASARPPGSFEPSDAVSSDGRWQARLHGHGIAGVVGVAVLLERWYLIF